MAKNLVIVESPAKAKTLKKYLGRDYEVRASVGHILDLPKTKLGVDIEKGFQPEYHVIRGKGKIIEELRKAARDKERIYLGPDPDREGEAIAWHIAQTISRDEEGESQDGKQGRNGKRTKKAKKDDGAPTAESEARRVETSPGPAQPKDPRIRRVLFHEITKRAVLQALENPRDLDRRLYEAQQTRRILDRLVGYQVSPLLWKKVRRGLSAGRVQSVALRLICEREREIRAFVPVEYWSLTAKLEGSVPPPFEAKLVRIGDRKLDPRSFRIENEEAARELVDRLRSATWRVTKVERKERKRNPAPPFTTPRLQQEAARKLGFRPSRTMRIAQRLYEGVELGPEGAVGLVTYIRTDSVRTAPEALEAVRGWIREKFGLDYLPEQPLAYKNKKGTQDAHEAIRPTSMEHTPERVAPYLSKEELALYTLVWNRFVASQMKPAVFDQTIIEIEADGTVFRASGQILKFDGFMRVYTEEKDENGGQEEAKGLETEAKGGEPEGKGEESEEEAPEGLLPNLSEGEELRLLELVPAQHFTQPPPRFTQATLIRELEEKGIGRPSTYATIVSTILDRNYVVEDKSRRLRPTELGFLVSDLLVEAFPDIFNVEFTARMESDLDEIEEGKRKWVEAMQKFYEPFSRDLAQAEAKMRDVKREGYPTDILCDACGAPMVIKWGRSGEFLACSKYPECKNTKNFVRDAEGNLRILEDETTDEVCDKCGKPMRVRFGRYGKFLGCTGYPECKNVRSLARAIPTGLPCPECREGEVLEKKSRRGETFFSCSRYPECRFATGDRPVPEPCPRCEAPFLVEKTTKRDGTVRRCLSEGCRYRETVAEAEAV
ncbi:MAG: DNA topoisomerase 1 [Candidatus Binatia bacterium]|nr:MAG: DNA topoisomerase 1 [Candidatus Binatia bacterium]